MKGRNSIWCFLVGLLLTSCVENDLPYPTIEGIIEEFAVEGQTSVKIDKTAGRKAGRYFGHDRYTGFCSLQRLPPFPGYRICVG